MADIKSSLIVRRSIHIKAPPPRVWQEFASFERMNLWWGVTHGTPEGGTPKGQRLLRYEPHKGGHIEMEVVFNNTPMR